MWQYNPKTDTWTQKANLPASARWSAVAFSLGNFGYYGTGTNLDSCFSDFWQYDPNIDEWTRIADFPRKQFESVEFVIGSEGYVGLGINLELTYYNEFWKYQPTSDSWIPIATLPSAGRKHAKAEAVGNSAIIAGGQSKFEYHSDCWKYSSFNDTWKEISPLPTTPIRGMSSFKIETHVYFINGLDSNLTKHKAVWRYEIKNDIFSNPLMIYPNPSSGIVNVDLNRLNQPKVKLSVYDLTGKLLKNHTIESDYIQLNCTNFQPGAYLFLFQTANTSFYKKVILTR
ncbi:MAG: T9SS type A sorting domain-containing protein [Flavobacteriales bacterium]|nr:T9SS type A sorting domain-containing protein [Flavobacteriales bacterium]